MKRVFPVFIASVMISAAVLAQDSTMPPDPTAGQVSTTSSDKMPASEPATSSSEMPTTDSAPMPSKSSGYGSGGYGSRAEVFVTGFGLFTSHATGNAVSQQATEAGGGSAGYRFHLNSWSALEGRYGFSRNSQKYTIGGAVSSIPSYLSEITGSYVYSLPKLQRIQPFLEGGGGIVHFSPGNYNNNSSSSGGGPTVGGPGGYSASIPAAPVYSSSTPGIVSQNKATFVYGIGADFPAFSRLYLRAEYRGLGYKAPDFKQAGLQTNAYNFLSEPSFGIVWHF